MSSETRVCQNCQKEFLIDQDDFNFYEKMKAPAPSWCPECRMIRRFMFRNEHGLFRRKDDNSGKEIFCGFPPQAPVKVYELEFWNSDGWDPIEYGRDYDFNKSFFEQFRELLYTVPWPAKSVMFMKNSEYSNNATGFKNSYLCFNGDYMENSGYVVTGVEVKESFDLYSARHSELCYEGYMIDEANRVLFSVNCENCIDVWFSRNLMGCNNCFGCVNLRNKSYYIFNKPYSREGYREYLKQFDLGSYRVKESLLVRAREFWIKFPMRFTLAIRVVNSTGEHIEKSKNLKCCYSIHEGENLAYCQFIEPPSSDSYDYTSWGDRTSLLYESLVCGSEAYGLKFCWECWPGSKDLEYSAFCRSSSDLFGCVGLKKKQYCILNKQYSKEDYLSLKDKIIKHMNDIPYVDVKGRTYKYGEFFPTEFSPFAYNETLAGDFFPLSQEEAEKRGYLWREPEQREYATTVLSANLPDHIKDVPDSIAKEIIKCTSCGRAYRVIQMEFDFLRRIGLPLPRLCPECRFKERFKFVNPPKLWPGRCMCAGEESENPPSLELRRAERKEESEEEYSYKNTAKHFHGGEHCPNEFETSYQPGRPEIVYCEQCYQQESS